MAKKKRLGRVVFKAAYIVDLDDPDMVDRAKECLADDIFNAVKMDEAAEWIGTEEDKTLSPADIPSFLTEE